MLALSFLGDGQLRNPPPQSRQQGTGEGGKQIISVANTSLSAAALDGCVKNDDETAFAMRVGCGNVLLIGTAEGRVCKFLY